MGNTKRYTISEKWLIRITGKPQWPTPTYMRKKLKKYLFHVPPVYLRAGFRQITGYQPTLEGKRILFVCGLHRSGTSLVHRLLKSHPDISGISNTMVPEDEGQHLQTVFPSDKAYGLMFAFRDEAHLTESSSLLTRENRRKLLREWGRFMNFDTRVIIEKSPSNILRTRFLQAMFPEACFAFLIRHPITTSLAVEKWVEEPIERIIEHWAHAHLILKADLPYLKNFIIIRYEDLLNDPQSCIRSILELCDLNEVSLSETIKDHNDKYFTAWENRDVNTEWINGFSTKYGNLLSRLGYSLEKPYLEFPSRGTRL